MEGDCVDYQLKSAQQKQELLNRHRVAHDAAVLTTDQGVPIANTDDSLKAGARGPTLMEDFHFREKLTHFDHAHPRARRARARVRRARLFSGV